MKRTIILLLILLSYAAHSQSFTVFDIDTSDFPIMRAKFIAFDENGKQVRNMSPNEITVTEDGVQREVLSISCPESKPVAISSVITTDISGSMQGTRLEWAKEGTRAWINGLPEGKSECALTTFNWNNFMVQEFTNDKQKLLSQVDSYNAGGGTNYNAAMLDPLFGGLLVTDNAQYKKVLVVVSDGMPNFEPQTQQIIDHAKQKGVVVYSVTLWYRCPNNLKQITEQTGGQWFENITNENKAREKYLTILNHAQNVEPCTIEWESEYVCNNKDIDVEFQYNSLISIDNYKIPKKGIIGLKILPNPVFFDEPEVGEKEEQKIFVTAKNDNFVITDILSSNNNFDIEPKSFSLEEGKSIELTVSYTATEKGYAVCKFDFITNSCNEIFYSSAFHKNSSPVENTLRLTHPKGGEKFLVGSDTIITWQGIPETEPLKIEFSNDNGNSWQTLTNSVNGLKYKWKNIPKPASTNCKIKVTQRKINNYNADSDTLQITLSGHNSSVTHISWSPDGSRVATASNDGTGIIWDATSGAKLQTLKGHTDKVLHISWSPDGSRVATASYDSTGIIWDATTGTKLYTLTGHTSKVNHISWSPDGSRVATASHDKTGIIWDATSGTRLHTLTGHTSYVTHISWSSDGSRVATASHDITGIIWDATNGTKLHTLTGHTGFVTHISWSPDGSRVATASHDKTGIIWDAATGTKLHTLTGHTSYVNHISWSPDGSRVATTASYDKTGIIWDATSGTKLHTLTGHAGFVTHISWSPDGSRVATASNDGTGIIWDATSGAKLQTLTGHKYNVFHISWSPDGSQVATASHDCSGIIWDAATGEILYSLKGHNGDLNNISWSPDGSFVATSSSDNTGIIWDATTSTILHTLTGHTNNVTHISWSPDGSRVATSSWDGTGIIWDASSGTKLHTLLGHTQFVTHISWSPDGSRVATSSWDGTGIIWDATTGTELFKMTGHSNYVNHISWSPDGSRVATASSDYTGIIWDAASGTKLHTLTGHTNGVTHISWSPDGSRVATASLDKTGIIWDATRGTKLHTLTGHTYGVTHISWSPDGSRIATASSDKLGLTKYVTGIIWDATYGAKLLTLSVNTYFLDHISWSPDGSKVATASSDKTGIIWDATSGTKLHTLTGHTSGVTHISWSPDGGRVATASGDKTAKIWFIGESYSTIQADSSDLFEIVMPRIASKEVDMKTVEMGGFRDSVVVEFITNQEPDFPVRIDSMYFEGDNPDDFSFFTDAFPFKIPKGSAKEMYFRFQPTDIGYREAKVVIITQADTLKYKIYGNSLQPELLIFEDFIDFGKVKLGDIRDTLQAVTIKNTGNSPLAILNTKHNKPNATDFTTLAGGGNFTMQPGDTCKMDLRFNATEIGMTSGTLEFHYDGPGSPAIIQLIADVYANPIIESAQIDNPQLLCENFEIIDIPIYNSGNDNLEITDANITGTNAGEFFIYPEFSFKRIYVDNWDTLQVLFNPVSTGDKTAQLNLTNNSENAQNYVINLNARKDSSGIELSTNSLLFEILTEFTTETQQIEIKNTGTTDLNWTEPVQINEFTLQNISPNPTPAGETSTADIVFAGASEGIYKETFTFLDDCGKTYTVDVTAEVGDPSQARATLQILDFEGEPGDEIIGKIFYNKGQNMNVAGITGFNLDLIFNPTLLYPTGYDIERIDDKTAKIRVEDIPLNAQQGEVLKSIDFIVGLGNAEGCDLILSNPTVNGGEAEIDLISGRFNLLGICYEGGTRLISPSSESGITSISPNPTDGEIEIGLNLIEKGYTKLTIYNTMGEKMSSILSENIEITGEQTINLDISEYSSGLYFIVLQTPSHHFTEEVMILK